MSIQKSSSSTALPIAYVTLQILIVVNWLMAAGILALLIVSIANEPWFMSAFKLSASPEAERVLMGLRAIAALGFAAIPLHYAVLKRLLAIVETVRAGDPFVAANAHRLQAIAWVLLALNLLQPWILRAASNQVEVVSIREAFGPDEFGKRKNLVEVVARDYRIYVDDKLKAELRLKLS